MLLEKKSIAELLEDALEFAFRYLPCWLLFLAMIIVTPTPSRSEEEGASLRGLAIGMVLCMIGIPVLLALWPAFRYWVIAWAWVKIVIPYLESLYDPGEYELEKEETWYSQFFAMPLSC